MYSTNPEAFFRRFLFTPVAPVYFFVLPSLLAYGYYRTSNKAYEDLYNKYVGNYTDEQLLELEGRFSPKKKIMYDYVIKKHKAKQASE